MLESGKIDLEEILKEVMEEEDVSEFQPLKCGDILYEYKKLAVEGGVHDCWEETYKDWS